MQRHQRSPEQLIKTLRGQMSCATRLLIEIGAVYGETKAPVDGDEQGMLELIGTQSFDLCMKLEELHNEIDDFGDRVRKAFGKPAAPAYRDRHHYLKCAKGHLVKNIEENEITRKWTPEQKKEAIDNYDYDCHRLASRVLARERA